MVKKYAIACGFIGLMTAFSTLAENKTSFTANNIHMDASLGWLSGKAEENYYDTDTGQKDDALEWKIKEAPILKMGISWEPMPWITLNAQGWTTLSSRGSTMDEYYWYTDDHPGWDEWDHHPNSSLNYANEFDVNIKGWVLNMPTYRLGGMVGYQQTRFSWTATGGSYQYYDDGDFEYGDYDFGQRYAGYKQKFTVPYLGIVGMYRYQDVEVNALFKFSPWVKARDNDDYYEYDSTYRNRSNNARYYAATVDIGYYLTPNAKIFTAFTWSKHKEGKGGSLEIDHDDGDATDYTAGDAAGIANKTYSVTAGLKYSF